MFIKLCTSTFKKMPIVLALVVTLGMSYGTAIASADQDPTGPGQSDQSGRPDHQGPNPGPTGNACSADNDIMTGGFSSPANFIQQIQNGDSSGHKDLADIYAKTGLSPADYANFVSSSVPGVVKRDGTVWAKGHDQPVGTNSVSFGRLKACQGSDPQALAGTEVWGNVTTKNFARDVDEIEVTILFDSTGTIKFAVMNNCGNSIKPTPVKPPTPPKPTPTPPPVMPKTGASADNTIAVFSAVVISGFLGYRQFLLRKSAASSNKH